jgi:PPK2 family polyphosphate:nucleotide phosphotransferase
MGADMRYAVHVAPSAKLDLGSIDPDQHGNLDKAEGLEAFAKFDARIDALQEELFAAGTHSILVILQGMDTSGKDGAIRTVFRSCNPQGMNVASFKVPTEEELAHDFLWRVHQVTPRKGMIGVFNRSHYEDVLVVRVHELVPQKIWKARYDQINAFEALLTANKTIILKFFLHISRDEQEQRLHEREQDPTTAWKLSASDWREREHWAAYMEANEDALRHCSTESAPWYVIPANHKWFRNLAIAEVLVETLEQHRDEWKQTLNTLAKTRLGELQAYRKSLNTPSKP